jgi:hypothetical protein
LITLGIARGGAAAILVTMRLRGRFLSVKLTTRNLAGPETTTMEVPPGPRLPSGNDSMAGIAVGWDDTPVREHINAYADNQLP